MGSLEERQNKEKEGDNAEKRARSHETKWLGPSKRENIEKK